jgi:rhamnogalacturonan endolyase
VSPAPRKAHSSDPLFAAEFYDDVAKYIPGFVPASGRSDFKANVSLPNGARDAKAVLAQNGVDFQDNVDFGE